MKSFAMNRKDYAPSWRSQSNLTVETAIFAAVPQKPGTRSLWSRLRIGYQQSWLVKIAQIAPLAESVPPQLYGGTERVVSWLTEELVSQGHEVTLFASGDSCTSAELIRSVPRGLRLDGIRDHTASLLVMLDDVHRRKQEFDIVHFHVDLLQFPLFK